MTAYEVDVDELVAVIAAIEACGGALADLAGDLETDHRRLHSGWSGLAGDAHAASHVGWRGAFGEMSQALNGLRGVGDVARANYTAAVDANLILWRQLG